MKNLRLHSFQVVKHQPLPKTRSLLILIVFMLMLFISGCSKDEFLSLSGTVEASLMEVTSEVGGKVASLHMEEGARVKEGDLIASVDASLQHLNVKQQESLLALKTSRLNDLKALPKAPQEQLKQVEADLEYTKFALEQAKLLLSKYQITSPMKGTLISSHVLTGSLINAGSSVGTVADLEDLWLNAYIPQKHLRHVSLEQEIKLVSSSLPDTLIRGEITFISSQGEFTPKNTETEEAKENIVYKVKIKILDHIADIRPGMTLNADIPLGGN